MFVRLIAGLACLLLCASVWASPPRTFNEAKKIGWKLYAKQSTEFYCGCKFSGKHVDLRSCG